VTPAVNNKLAKLVRLLSSDKDGEVLAAASAITRTLAAEGSDIHALADTLCRPQPQRGPRHDDDNDWHSISCECQAHSERFSPREQDFVADMSGGRRSAHSFCVTPSQNRRVILRFAPLCSAL
jgi:hypothetical protein